MASYLSKILYPTQSSAELASKELSQSLLRNYRGLKLIESCAAADSVKMKKE